MDINLVAQRTSQMKNMFRSRDQRMARINMVREGRMHELPGVRDFFSAELPRAVTANICDTAARDLAEVMAALPDLACSSGTGSGSAVKKAEMKDRIGRHYWKKSDLESTFVDFGDHYVSYGFAVLAVDPNYSEQMPFIRVENPMGFYYIQNMWRQTVEVSKSWCDTIQNLVALFPDQAARITAGMELSRVAEQTLEVIRYTHKDSGTVLFIPERGNLVLDRFAPVVPGCLPYFVVQRSGLSPVPTGQFDETLWIQYAREIMEQYKFRLTERSVNAPVVIPTDVGEFEEGAGAVIRTDNLKPGHGIMNLQVPQGVFQESQTLEQEVKESARYPDVRSGQIKASIVTGRGVEALLGTFDTQIKTAQTLFKRALEQATDYAFRLDVAKWGDVRKTITGVESGQSFKFAYTPSKDIGEDYSCTVTYGFQLGNSPAQALLMMLQLQSAGLMSATTVQRRLPFDVDPDFEQREIVLKRFEQSLVEGVAATAQSIGIQLQQGASPEQAIGPFAKLIPLIKKGKPVEEAVLEAFAPKPPPETEAPNAAESTGAPASPEGDQLPPGMMDTGLMRGVAPGQAGMRPGAQPDLQTIIGSMRGENPQLSATTLRRRAV